MVRGGYGGEDLGFGTYRSVTFWSLGEGAHRRALVITVGGKAGAADIPTQ